MQKIVPHLWFDNQAEEAANFYASLFDDSSIGRIGRYGKAGQEIHGRPEGSVMTVDFELAGFEFMALNGGPHFTFTPAISFFVILDDADQVNELWEALIDGGQALMPIDAYPWSERYGWLNDRYGLSWQIMVGERHREHTIVPSLFFVGDQSGNCEEAIEHYISTFPDSEVGALMRYDGSGVDPQGNIQHGQFYLAGQDFRAMESAMEEHAFGFNEAISFLVRCDTQEEIDQYWNALSAVPEAEQCGWLKDRFGVSWQITPTVLPELLDQNDRPKFERVMSTMLQMKKIDISELERAGRDQS